MTKQDPYLRDLKVYLRSSIAATKKFTEFTSVSKELKGRLVAWVEYYDYLKTNPEPKEVKPWLDRRTKKYRDLAFGNASHGRCAMIDTATEKTFNDLHTEATWNLPMFT